MTLEYRADSTVDRSVDHLSTWVDSGGVRWIVFDNPRKRNALDREMLAAVTALVRRAATENTAIVFTGAGDRAFSAGMHLNTFADLDTREAAAVIGELGHMLTAVRTSPVPTIAAINGFCLGAVFELALVCDLRVARSDTAVGLPEVKIGVPSVLDASLLAQYIGLSAAKEVMLLGELHSVESLAHTGLFNRVVAANDLDATVSELLAQFAALPPHAIAAQKTIFEDWLNTVHTVGCELSQRAFASVFGDDATHAALGEARAPKESR